MEESRDGCGGRSAAVAEQLPLGLCLADRRTDNDAGVSIAHIGRAGGEADTVALCRHRTGGRDSAARGDSHRPIDCRGVVVGLARLELRGQVKT